MPIRYDCPCGKTLAIPDAHAGEQTYCPACNRRFVVPQPGAPAAPGAEQLRCPSCGEEVQPGAVFCTSCGLNMQTGEATGSTAPQFGSRHRRRSWWADVRSWLKRAAVLAVLCIVVWFLWPRAIELLREGGIVPNTPVVGIESARLYHGEDLSEPTGDDLAAGDGVEVLTQRAEVLKVRTGSGKTGWVPRYVVCSHAELARRERLDVVPSAVHAVGSDRVGGGGRPKGISVTSSTTGFAVWFKSDCKGMDLRLNSRHFVIDTKVLYFLKETGEVIELRIW